MPRIVFIEAGGLRHEVAASSGRTVMQAAMDASVPGIVAECGGCCSCATCHGFIDAPWSTRIAPAGAVEVSMLEGLLELQPNSRLTCQIEVTEELDGMVVRLPSSQT
jgi:2Fe-2S ferredoxin